MEIAPLEVTEMTALLAAFRGDVTSPGTYTALYRKQQLWMSDTDDEIRDMLEAVRQVRRRGGRVLVNGLGLGCFLNGVLSSENVERVDVVEIDPNVIQLVAPHYVQDPRVRVIHGDALTMTWPRGTRWTVAWHDIWEDIDGSDEQLEEMTRLRRMYGHMVDWQDVWGERLLSRVRMTRW